MGIHSQTLSLPMGIQRVFNMYPYSYNPYNTDIQTKSYLYPYPDHSHI
ncbi:hypothetical protein CCHR01_13180 [Colletotrichum chrysophilum]|uniref:Uncharacterized protein n=1 Tax=Colletotrichum chrysophilum TaxID=1836956 RepID=A0AAD9AAD7_9PEZI|nr:hypothetical protein CCHR01_13180 [Colletotrichum chrysophilum]